MSKTQELLILILSTIMEEKWCKLFQKVLFMINLDTIKITVSMETVFKSKPFLSSLIENKCE
jgi:hypothetical protein